MMMIIIIKGSTKLMELMHIDLKDKTHSGVVPLVPYTIVNMSGGGVRGGDTGFDGSDMTIYQTKR